VIGRAFLIVWPPSRIRILPIPATFNQPGLHKAAGRTAGAGHNSGSVIQLKPSAPYLPVAAGLAAAAPLMLIRRSLRRRAGGRPGSRWPWR
jgi:signal peptidase I